MPYHPVMRVRGHKNRGHHREELHHPVLLQVDLGLVDLVQLQGVLPQGGGLAMEPPRPMGEQLEAPAQLFGEQPVAVGRQSVPQLVQLGRSRRRASRASAGSGGAGFQTAGVPPCSKSCSSSLSSWVSRCWRNAASSWMRSSRNSNSSSPGEAPSPGW